MEIHFGVGWFENVHHFLGVGTGDSGISASLLYGRQNSNQSTLYRISIVFISWTKRCHLQKVIS